MRHSRFTKSQIIGIIERLRAGESVAELCEEYRISSSTIYSWRIRFGSTVPENDRAFHRVQRENRRLRKIIAGMLEETDKLKGVIRRNRLNLPDSSETDSGRKFGAVPGAYEP